MKDMYQIAGISKQALWGYNKGNEHKAETTREVVGMMSTIRKRHSRMGCRRMYYMVREQSPVGRDLFEQIGFANGFRLRLKRNKMKTTWGQRVEIFPDLISGNNFNGINQVWQSDFFYLKVESTDYYGVSIEDIYSRKLLALHISQSLSAEELVRAVKKAIQARKGQDLSGCIFHSDRGSQYISYVHKTLLKATEMHISMCKLPQQNAYVERVQGTLKYEYLFEYKLTKDNLQRIIRKIQRYYNDERPHENLNMKTPTAYEKYVTNLPEDERPVLKIHDWDTGYQQNQVEANKKKKEAKKKK